MPLNAKGEKILGAMEETYGSTAEAKHVLYASKNAGKITGIDEEACTGDGCPAMDETGPSSVAAHQVSLAEIQRRNREFWGGQFADPGTEDGKSR